MVSAETTLGVMNWCLNFIGILIFLSISFTIVKCRRELRNISFVLTCNTCLAALLTCLTICIMSASNLSTGFLTSNLGFCRVWGLLYDIFECSIYHSYYLQAVYRLCRVVFYKKKSLVSYSLYIMLIIGQWLLTIILLLPPIFLNWYSLLPMEQYCLVPYTDLVAEIYHIVILYMIPLVCITTTYIWITIFMRTSSRTSTVIMAAQQRQRNLRDLTVIKRIVILISILIVLRFPTVIFMIYAVSVGQLYWFTFDIVGLITSACLIFIGLITIHITPELRKVLFVFLMCRDNRIHAQETIQQHLAIPTRAAVGDTPRTWDKTNRQICEKRSSQEENVDRLTKWQISHGMEARSNAFVNVKAFRVVFTHAS